MSLTLHSTITPKKPTSANNPKPLIFSTSIRLNPKTQVKFIFSTITQLNPTKVNAFSQEQSQYHAQVETSSKSPSSSFNFDAFLSIVELLSLASAVTIVAYVAVSGNTYKNGVLGSVIWVVVVGCAIIGSVMRRRQWNRVSGSGLSSVPSDSGLYLTKRVEKLEEDFRGSVTVIRVLSRQIEKLGIRVRAYRKALKEPIAETAALAQKNSEATRALAAQEDLLEKELSEVQKVLLAMQDQQQKQLELILAIGKAGKLWGNKPPSPSKEDQDSSSEISSPCNKSSADEVLKL